MIKNEFLNLYEELSELNEDSREKNLNPIKFTEIEDLRTHNRLLSSDEALYKNMSDIGVTLAQHFLGDKKYRVWTKQIQLMYNAWVTEKIALEQLNNTGSALHTEITAALNDTEYALASEYEFNQNAPNDHTMLGICGNNDGYDYSTADNKACYDIKAIDSAATKSDKKPVKSIEIKLSGKDNYLSDLLKKAHNAQIVIMFKLKGPVDIYFHKSLLKSNDTKEKYVNVAHCDITFKDQLISIKKHQMSWADFMPWHDADAEEEKPLTEKWIEDMNN